VQPKRPEPTFKEILRAIKRIVDQGSGLQRAVHDEPPKPHRGISLGLVLIAIIGMVILTTAFVKFLQQN
jgi:hypothetical protein